MNARQALPGCIRLATGLASIAAMTGCGGPDFRVAPTSGSRDSGPDVGRSPIICDNCPDPPAPRADDGGDATNERSGGERSVDSADGGVAGDATVDGGGGEGGADGSADGFRDESADLSGDA